MLSASNAKGIMTDDEDRNPVETQLESFFNDSRTSGHPKDDPEVGLGDRGSGCGANRANLKLC